jgi:dihydrofolate reductase
MEKISIIVSVSENWAIGKDNQLLWKLSSDLKNFKKLTTGHSIIMGLNTMKSLPNQYLPNRTNIVLVDDPDFVGKNIITAFSITDALDKAIFYDDSDEIFIIGGASIYKQFLPISNKLYLTVVHTEIDGDTFFPKIDESEWTLESSDFKEKDEKNEYSHTYKIYTR